MAIVAAGCAVIGAEALTGSGTATASPDTALATNPDLDPGTPLRGPAPDFTLHDQFGRRVSLHAFRGKVVILAFTDSVCTTVCPLTTTAMQQAKAMLGPAASRVALVGVDANPAATSLEDVLSYSQLHGMTHSWEFLTGSLRELKRVWKRYAIQADIERGLIAHTPALMVIGPDGIRSRLYMTQQSYAAIGQLSQILARNASSLLPGHPKVDSHRSYAPITGIPPTSAVSLPSPGGGHVALGPGRPHLSMFFATWDQGTMSIGARMSAMNAYATQARRSGLPALTAVDEGTVEPNAAALPTFLRSVPQRLDYPVGVDQTGRVADGYEVQGEPWFVLTSASGHILWYWQVATQGWLTPSQVLDHVRAALTRTPAAPATPSAVQQSLAGSPPPLAALHSQAGRLLGSVSAMSARVRALRGYPIVINAWASWCTPCRAEFGLFAAASARYGRKVAFLGADTNDSSGDAQSFLSQHPVGYPSYRTASTDLSRWAAIEGLPTTIFLDPTGKVLYVHTGQYDSQGSLDEDIAAYASGG